MVCEFSAPGSNKRAAQTARLQGIIDWYEILLKKWTLAACTAVICLFLQTGVYAADVELVPSSRVILQLTAEMEIDEIIRRVYPEDSALWPELKAALIETNPDSFEPGTDRLIPGAKLQLLDIERVVDQPEGIPKQKIGKVVAVSGTVSVVDDRDQVQLVETNAAVYQGDRIVSGRDAVLHLRLYDGAEIFLKPDSVIELSEYEVDRSAGQNRSVVDLLRGGLRKITGAIGTNENDEYRLETGYATVGIRGTEYVVKLCRRDDCTQSSDRDDSETWLHAAVLDGEISLDADGRQSLQLAAGEYGIATADRIADQPSISLADGFLDSREAEAFEAANAQSGEAEAAPSKNWLWGLGLLLLLAIGL